jgi:hypothetical protein
MRYMVYVLCFVHYVDNAKQLHCKMLTTQFRNTTQYQQIMYDAIHEVTWYMVKQYGAKTQLYYQAYKILMMLIQKIKNCHPLGTLFAIMMTTSFYILK